MPLQLTMPPATEPVTLQQAKTWLKVETDDEDTLIASLIPAARARAEWHTGRAFITQGWTLWLDSAAAEIEIPLPPLRAVTSVTLYRADGGEEVLDVGDYTVDVPGSRLIFGKALTGLRAINGIAIAFSCGYGEAADVPAPIASTILLLLAALYEHRGETYASGLGSWTRPITRPVAGSVRAAVDGVETAVTVAGGTISFAAAPADGAVITAGYAFDCAVRFDSDALAVNLATFTAGEIPAIVLIEVLS